MVQVTARAICGSRREQLLAEVVLPPPEGAEISTSKGLVIGMACSRVLMIFG